MSPDPERRLEEIFSAARDLPPLQRAAFLEWVRGARTNCSSKRIRCSLRAVASLARGRRSNVKVARPE